jgi:uncharacterized membrane protein
VPPVSAASPSPPQSIGFEERFGTRWVVWVGGIALALGGIFLVRYTIQQGLIGPGVRIALGALLAAALVAIGEWSRFDLLQRFRCDLGRVPVGFQFLFELMTFERTQFRRRNRLAAERELQHRADVSLD